VAELKAAGAEVVEPIAIPKLKELISMRSFAATGGGGRDSMEVYLSRNPNSPFKNMQDVRNSPDFAKVFPGRFPPTPATARSSERGVEGPLASLQAREELTINVMKVMADYKLDAIVHKSVEHTPTLISEGLKPPYPSKKGSITLNTFLIYVASMTVPAGFTREGLPVGITFFGRAYAEPAMIKMAYAYEQATRHRIPPKTTPALSGGISTASLK
jgi:amidase